MKLSVSNKNLFQALAVVGPAVNPRSTLPILSHVNLRAGKNTLTLEATDLDVYASCTVEAAVEQTGGCVMPARKLAAIVKETDGAMEIAMPKPSKAEMRSGTSAFSLMVIAADEFPPQMSVGEELTRFVITQKTLKTMLRNTSYAASSDETRYILNGVYFNVSGFNMVMACSDGRRLAVDNTTLPGPDRANGCAFIIPNKPVAHLERLLQDTEDQVEVVAGVRGVCFKCGQWSLTAKQIEGNYPDFNKLIPSNKTKLVLNREQFAAAVRRAALIGGISVRLIIGNNRLSIYCADPSLGEAQEEMAVKHDGAELEMFFDPLFLRDALNAMQCENVILELDASISPALLRADGGTAICLIMPMRG